MKPKLLVVECWGLGDLAIATPFLRAAGERFQVTLLAKPYALDLQPRFWPGVKVVPFVAPWTAFHGKYRLHTWPWSHLLRVRGVLRREAFQYGLSARWDPRDHVVLWAVRAEARLGFPRAGSRRLLTQPVARPDPDAHRYESWRTLGEALGFQLPPRESALPPSPRHAGAILLHTGAAQVVRVWPLGRYRRLAARLRAGGHRVHIACDPDQAGWWKAAGEPGVETVRTVSQLLQLLDGSSVLVGNDSGPGHLAALCGLPTFTLFGPQLPQWFAPLHPQSAWLGGHPCPYRPCSDYCRLEVPHCLFSMGEEEVFAAVNRFLASLGAPVRDANQRVVTGAPLVGGAS